MPVSIKNVLIIAAVCIGALIVALVFMSPTLLFNSEWKTQIVLYRSIKDPADRIEFQMQDAGSAGYYRRTVRVSPGIFFDRVLLIDTSLIHKDEWKPVHETVNELHLKGGIKTDGS